jgi:hypothetical protein
MPFSELEMKLISALIILGIISLMCTLYGLGGMMGDINP